MSALTAPSCLCLADAPLAENGPALPPVYTSATLSVNVSKETHLLFQLLYLYPPVKLHMEMTNKFTIFENLALIGHQQEHCAINTDCF